MKKQSFKVIASAVILTLAGLAVFANGAEERGILQIEIPFEFQIGNELHPAGKYRVDYNREKNYIVVRGLDSGRSTTVLTSSSSLFNRNHKEAKLTFNRYGSRRFLRFVNSPASNLAIKASRAEKQIRKGGGDKMMMEVTVGK